MTKSKEYEAKTESLVMPILEANSFELYDVEYIKEGGNWYLRIYIDKEDGITVEDCELVSRAMNDILDEKDYIQDAYIFEVSSPGLGRQLKKDKHFQKSIGEEVELKLFKARNKQKDFSGILVGFDEDKLVIEQEDGSNMEFSRADVAMVRLALDF